MRSEKSDRRSRRTQKILSEALIELLPHKRYDEITVQDILDRADVGRSTFYAHYRDKDDLLISNLERVFSMLRDHSHISTPKDEVLPSLALLKHMQEYLPIHKALVRGGAGDLLYKKMHDYWSRTIEAYFSAHMTQKHKMAVPLPILANYIAGSCTNLIKWWLEHNIPCSPEEMLHIFQLLVWPGVEAALVSEE